MHQTRQETTLKLPIKRKGTKYVARALSHQSESVPVLVAVRDMLKLARTAREAKEMIKSKALKLNGRTVIDYNEGIKFFNVFEADKNYVLTILPTGKFALQESKDKNERLCKVTDKRIFNKGRMQINLHDGTNILAKEKINVGDSVYLDFDNKIKRVIKMEKGAEAFVISGKYVGVTGKIDVVDGKKIKVKFKDKTAELNERQVIVR